MDPTPWRSPNLRQALGASTATQRSTTRTSRITIVTPRRPTVAPGKNPSEPPFTNGGWWGNATAPTSSALLLCLRLYAQRPAESSPFFVARFHGQPSDSAAPPSTVGATDGHRDPEAVGDSRRGHD